MHDSGIHSMPTPATRGPKAFLQRVFRTRAEDRLPIKVEHQRIYILPTRRGWAFLAVLLLMLIGSVNYALSLGYALSFLLTGLFAASLLQTYQNLAGLELDTINADTAFSGEPLSFRLKLSNQRSRARTGIRVSARVADPSPRKHKQIASVIALLPESVETLTLALPTQQRGHQALGRLTLESDWPLGLWKAWSYVHTPVHGLVFPAAESEPPPVPVATTALDGQTARAGQQGDVAGLRTYVPGDSPGTIAWKSAARGQGLHVRLFDDETGANSAHLDFASTRLADPEAGLSRLVAWILTAEATSTPYGFELPGTQLPMDNGPAHKLSALTACALYGKPS